MKIKTDKTISIFEQLRLTHLAAADAIQTMLLVHNGGGVEEMFQRWMKRENDIRQLHFMLLDEWQKT